MTPKYQGEQDLAVHGGQLHWPGNASGYPFRARGGMPVLRDDQYAKLQLECDFQAAVFRTWEPQSLAAYRLIMDRCANRSFALRRQLQEFDREKGGWIIWLEWLQPYAAMPAAPNR